MKKRLKQFWVAVGNTLAILLIGAGWKYLNVDWGVGLLCLIYGASLLAFTLVMSHFIRPWIEDHVYLILEGAASAMDLQPGIDRLSVYRRHWLFRKHTRQACEYVPKGRATHERKCMKEDKGLVGQLFPLSLETSQETGEYEPEYRTAYFGSEEKFCLTYADLEYTPEEIDRLDKRVRMAIAVSIPTEKDERIDWVIYYDTIRDYGGGAEARKAAGKDQLKIRVILERLAPTIAGRV